MYIPDHFLVDDEAEIAHFIEQNGFGELISMVDEKLFATHLPFLYQRDENKLLAHIARANPQWQELEGQSVLAILWGAHGYVSPSWYSAPGVPTWNYQAVHITGTAKCVTDAVRLAQIVTALTHQYESGLAAPWVPTYQASKIQGIVGIEITIEQIQCKYKLSQNRSQAERSNIAQQLQSVGKLELAEAIRKLS